MAKQYSINLSSVGLNIDKVDLYINPGTGNDNGTITENTGLTASTLTGVTLNFPDNTVAIRVVPTNGPCAGQGYDLVMPSPTPTVTVTPTLTPTPTTVKYWLKMLRCDEDQTLLNYHYSLNSYVNNTIQRGDLFRGGPNGQPGPAPAGFFYYEVVDLLLTNPSGTVEGSKSVAPYATNCGEDPTHFVSATYRTAHMTMNYYSGYTSVSQITGTTSTCGKLIYQVPAGSVTRGAYFEASVTGTTPTPGIAYAALYSGSTDGTAVWGESVIANEGHYWAVALGGGNQYTHIVYINNGAIGGWYDCATGNQIYYP